MKCGWGCGAQLTGRSMRVRFTICAKRPAGSGDVERRRGTLKVKRGRPAGPLMKCGWGRGEQLTGPSMRTHFNNRREAARRFRAREAALGRCSKVTGGRARCRQHSTNRITQAHGAQTSIHKQPFSPMIKR